MANTHVIIVGDGPGGLSAALLLAKNDANASVYGQDNTAMHAAMLHNYLGIEGMTGSEFQAIARRQVAAFGATLEDARVESVRVTDDGVEAELADGTTVTGDYLVLSEGKSPRLATQLGLEHDADDGIAVDANNRTSLDRVYAVGRLVRPGRSQAIISAGDGAAAAIDILSREAGENVMDWDTPGD